MIDIFEILKDLKVVSRALEDTETPLHPQTIFAKYKARELIKKELAYICLLRVH